MGLWATYSSIYDHINKVAAAGVDCGATLPLECAAAGADVRCLLLLPVQVTIGVDGGPVHVATCVTLAAGAVSRLVVLVTLVCQREWV